MYAMFNLRDRKIGNSGAVHIGIVIWTWRVCCLVSPARGMSLVLRDAARGSYARP